MHPDEVGEIMLAREEKSEYLPRVSASAISDVGVAHSSYIQIKLKTILCQNHIKSLYERNNYICCPATKLLND